MATLHVSDGFETGAASASWTVVNDGGADGSVVTTKPFEGSYSYQIVLNDKTTTSPSKSHGASDTSYSSFRMWLDPSDFDAGSDITIASSAGGLTILKLVESGGVLNGVLTMFSTSQTAVAITETGWHQFRVMAHRSGESWVDIVPPRGTFLQASEHWFYTKNAGAGASQLFGMSFGDAIAAATIVNSTVYIDAIEFWSTYPGKANLIYPDYYQAPLSVSSQRRSVLGPGSIGGL